MSRGRRRSYAEDYDETFVDDGVLPPELPPSPAMQEHENIFQNPSSFLAQVVSQPVNLSFNALSKGWDTILPFAPQIVPLLVCLCLVPVLLFLSATAGWVVWRNVAVGWSEIIYLQYGDGVPPYAEFPLPDLVARQPYDISLQLTLPCTESNFALGNFMTALTLTVPNLNTGLASIRRPAILSPPKREFWPFSRPQQTMTISIPLLHAFVPRTTRVLARVELGRKDGWKSLGTGEGKEISVLSASLRGEMRYQGVRGLVTRFPIVFSLISAGGFLAISSLLLGACLVPIILRNLDSFSGSGQAHSESLPEEPLPPNFPLSFGSELEFEDEKPSLGPGSRRDRGKWRRLGGSLSPVRKEVKFEDEIVPLTPSQTASGSMRRRSSTRFDSSESE